MHKKIKLKIGQRSELCSSLSQLINVNKIKLEESITLTLLDYMGSEGVD